VRVKGHHSCKAGGRSLSVRQVLIFLAPCDLAQTDTDTDTDADADIHRDRDRNIDRDTGRLRPRNYQSFATFPFDAWNCEEGGVEGFRPNKAKIFVCMHIYLYICAYACMCLFVRREGVVVQAKMEG